jgi:hypothetical protein
LPSVDEKYSFTGVFSPTTTATDNGAITINSDANNSSPVIHLRGKGG